MAFSASLDRDSIWTTCSLFTGNNKTKISQVGICFRSFKFHRVRLLFMSLTFSVSCSLFGFIVLHMLMYAGNIFYWRRYRVNYSFIFGFKQGTELGYREVLLFSFTIAVLALLTVLGNLDMEIDPRTKDFNPMSEVLPLILLIVRILNLTLLSPLVICLLLGCVWLRKYWWSNFSLNLSQLLFAVLFLPFNILYRSSRFFFLTSLFHCIAAPLYKVRK